ncbi:MAG: hypothetical protein IPK82_20085 [Polyangiaceae bacterium]|nr:hypothetical protein [Polyangiaceae bacterium]
MLNETPTRAPLIRHYPRAVLVLGTTTMLVACGGSSESPKQAAVPILARQLGTSVTKVELSRCAGPEPASCGNNATTVEWKQEWDFSNIHDTTVYQFLVPQQRAYFKLQVTVNLSDEVNPPSTTAQGMLLLCKPYFSLTSWNRPKDLIREKWWEAKETRVFAYCLNGPKAVARELDYNDPEKACGVCGDEREEAVALVIAPVFDPPANSSATPSASAVPASSAAGN